MTLIICLLIPVVHAVNIFGEEKIIFTAEDGAYAYGAIDSGNILISEIYPAKDGSGWSRLYLYNISSEILEELPVDDPPDFKHMDLYKNIAVWKGKFNLYAYNIDERNAPQVIAENLNSVNGLKIEDKTLVITGRYSFPRDSDYDHGDIYTYNFNDGSLTCYELPGCQGTVAISGKYIVFSDDRYGQMKNTVHVMNLETSDRYQISDEEKGVYSSPDISGENIVYRFDEDFGSFLKDEAPQQLLLTDISTNKTRVIAASPGARISSPKIDGDNIVWGDKRKGTYYSIWLYNLNENNETLISDTEGEYGNAVDISGDTVMWSDPVDGRSVLKIKRIASSVVSGDIPENTQQVLENPGTSDLEDNPPKTAGLSSGLPLLAVILGLCCVVRRMVAYKK
ncbi:MAG: hypothetical protein KAW93_05705 [Methanogenium sp.]|nr:hypothetical protein [Methanogenium sp.]